MGASGMQWWEEVCSGDEQVNIVRAEYVCISLGWGSIGTSEYEKKASSPKSIGGLFDCEQAMNG